MEHQNLNPKGHAMQSRSLHINSKYSIWLWRGEGQVFITCFPEARSVCLRAWNYGQQNKEARWFLTKLLDVLVISVILCSHACFKARLPLYFPEKLDNLFSPQQFLLGFCVMLCLSTIKAVNAQICSKHSTYFNSVKESSMNSSLNIPLEGKVFGFFFFFWQPPGGWTICWAFEKERGRTQRHPSFAQIQANQTNERNMFFLIHWGGRNLK